MPELELTDEERFSILRKCGFEPISAIEYLKADLDRTLLRRNLRLSAAERLDQLDGMIKAAAELQASLRRRKTK